MKEFERELIVNIFLPEVIGKLNQFSRLSIQISYRLFPKLCGDVD